MKQDKLNNIFEDMTKSILSRSEKEYQTTIEEGFIRQNASISLTMESHNSLDMDSIVDNLEEYSSDDFSNNLKKSFRKLVGKEGKYTEKETIGTHPDFIHIEGTNDIENHYIVSMFVDIKNSTSIYLKTNDLLWTKHIKNTMLRIITVFMQVFDGHVHRLQGDAVFSYFGWKDKCEEDAIIDSLNAASFLLYYIEKSLNEKFEEEGFSPIKLRIGIDFGKKDDVIWSEYGLFPSTEVTTTSLHTDLAAKLQSEASANTIMIGDNIKDCLDLPDEFLKVKTYQTDYEKKEKIYILDKPEKKYKMWIFQHKNYLKYFPFLENTPYNMKCFINENEYFPNISILDKGLNLTYNALHSLTIPAKGVNNIRFEWSKENRGKESIENKSEGKLPVNKTRNDTAEEGTSFRGHHIMKCKIFQNNRLQHEIKFGIFIK